MAIDTQELRDRAAELEQIGPWKADEVAYLRKAADEIDRLRAERDWRPIEEAPTDGAEFLAWDSEDGRYLAQRGWDYLRGELAWEETTELLIVHPTHWMPLPPEPGGNDGNQ